MDMCDYYTRFGRDAFTFTAIPRVPYKVLVSCLCGEKWEETHSEKDVRRLLLRKAPLTDLA